MSEARLGFFRCRPAIQGYEPEIFSKRPNLRPQATLVRRCSHTLFRMNTDQVIDQAQTSDLDRGHVATDAARAAIHRANRRVRLDGNRMTAQARGHGRGILRSGVPVGIVTGCASNSSAALNETLGTAKRRYLVGDQQIGR